SQPHTLSLHDALPILASPRRNLSNGLLPLTIVRMNWAMALDTSRESIWLVPKARSNKVGYTASACNLLIALGHVSCISIGFFTRSEEHTSELQSRENL